MIIRRLANGSPEQVYLNIFPAEECSIVVMIDDEELRSLEVVNKTLGYMGTLSYNGRWVDLGASTPDRMHDLMLSSEAFVHLVQHRGQAFSFVDSMDGFILSVFPKEKANLMRQEFQSIFKDGDFRKIYARFLERTSGHHRKKSLELQSFLPS